MSATIAPEGVPPEVVNARRTESIDAPYILKLVQNSTATLFGRVNVVNIIEKAVLAVTLVNDKDEILGHAAFFDYPNLDSVDPAEWENWMGSYYDCKKVSSLNSLFLHYFVAKTGYVHGCAREIIRTAFNAVPDVHYLFLVVPKNVYPEAEIADLFKPMNKGETTSGPLECAIFVCHRHKHVPVLHIRHARVEDHDDLTPIFNRHSDMLKMTYGDYFLSELIEAQDENMNCLVSEVDGTAYGFMSISSDVNYKLLNECFELGPFHGLQKSHPDDITTLAKTPTPPPKEELETQDRTSSRASSKSGEASKGIGAEPETKRGDANKIGEGTPAKTDEKKESGSKQSSRRSSRADSMASETKIKPRLSDANMGGSSGSLLSDKNDAEAVTETLKEMEAASRRDSQASQESAFGSSRAMTQMTKLPKRFVPTYYGDPNAFCIQLFCIDERYEMRSVDFLAKAFTCFPDRDFCIITVPHLVPEFPLLQEFVRITPRCPSTLSQELYVFHKSGLLKDFMVRPACTNDYSGVEKLVKNVDLHENLLKDLQQYNRARRDNDGTELQAFVAESQKQIVGIAIIRREEDIEYLRSHYNIEDFIYFNHHKRDEHGHLHHYALNPVFSHLSKHFLKEILRLGHKTCLYYPLYPPYTDKSVVEKHSLIGALPNMVPVRHRRQIVYPLDKLRHNSPSDRVLNQVDPYALNHINRKLTLEPKVTINARIVVVGASDVGIGFLEALAYCPHLRFNNLTLISPHGLPGEMAKDEQRDLMLSTGHCFNHTEAAMIALRTWVNVVYGKMTVIDRKKKVVIVNNDTVVPYDHLVICTGQQYQIPAPTDVNVSSGVTNDTLPNSPDRRYFGVKPKNLFTINDEYDAAVALYWIENILVKYQKKAIVYGSTLDAYTCVQTLVSMGLAADKISMVQPPPAYEVSCFNNPVVEEAMLDALKELGVDIYEGYYLAQWNDGKESTEVKSATFTSQRSPLRLDCGVFFSYYKKAVDYDAFRAINDACLVYDGKLVIDAYFHTNDVAIRGAGSLTKFQRKYHADKWTHANFNSKEVGVHLATEMLHQFDPTVDPQSGPQEEPLNLIPIYRLPKIKGAFLPGGYHYLHVSKPGLDVSLQIQTAQSDYGQDLVTGKPGQSPEFFCLHINQYKSVQTITCLSKKPFPSNNMICLYGLHEKSLNNLLSRFDEGLITDFYSYFQEAWCLAVYHDRFADFRDELRELLITRQVSEHQTLEDKVRELIDEDIPLSESQRKELFDIYSKSGSKRDIETRLLNFLTYNYYHLPMYAKPGMV
ncbi:hypothetical protein CHS0354_029969 [Potamilus streckersoni]|uniref:Cilia- and flagella-associated protein 61 N-terminal domain-containing protein n=1 Tax=Potamilus streckersoni TaxID=2493646 RepID=A0AAE0TK02_9BIVA|nr:hypothetical protein CHS0354_029969 [Potamilus streckersoni]